MKDTIRSLIGAARILIVLAPACAIHPAVAQSDNKPVTLGAIQVLQDEPNYLDFAAGAFNIQENQYSSMSPMARVEFRYGNKLWVVGPGVGMLANLQGGAMAYVGLYANFKYDRIVVTPLAGPGAYRRGGSEDLGGVFQFHLSLTVAYEFDDSSRLGLQLGHISNANLHDHNPSENDLLLSYAIPF